MATSSNQSPAMVKVLGQVMSIVEALPLLLALPEDALLTAEEAAVFMRRSVSTLERWRKDGSGPDYEQDVKAGAKGTNQVVHYVKAALIEWRKANTVSSSLEAAVKKGQAFATIFDLAEGLPFYVMPDGAVESMVEDNTVGQVIERLGGAWDIMWLTPVEAASRRWSNLVRHRDFAGRVQQALSAMQAGIAQAIEDTDLSESF